ncbi:techylectin-5B-like [Limulus polyphemus]|uniref:Techylectin-5B-like n=1 Tax=Limulus polyphemus TaxID=6850 RepID=A0ABM1BCQ2_LIMPO|nr:techylectin-5B-like [Limulus polyphemus]
MLFPIPVALLSNLLLVKASFSIDDIKKNCRPNDCYDIRRQGFFQSGVYIIWPRFFNQPVQVFCDMVTEGGGWTVIQRRDDIEPRQDFNLPWTSYKYGFGNVTGEFWIGNDILFALTNKEDTVLRVDLETFDREKAYAEYGGFLVRGERDFYKMMVGAYHGNAGDSLSYHNDTYFSTKDKFHNKECAKTHQAAWWFKDCTKSLLNGIYQSDGRVKPVVIGLLQELRFQNLPSC